MDITSGEINNNIKNTNVQANASKEDEINWFNKGVDIGNTGAIDWKVAIIQKIWMCKLVEMRKMG